MKRHSKGSAISFQWRSKALSVLGDVGDVGEVVRLEHLALDDREVDLDLVEPAGVQRQVDEDEVRPAPLEPLDRALAAVRGAVVDDPEDAAGGGVGLVGHHLPDEPVEGCDPARFGSERPNTRGRRRPLASDVERGQVGERPSALVGVLDSLPARARGRASASRGCAAAPGSTASRRRRSRTRPGAAACPASGPGRGRAPARLSRGRRGRWGRSRSGAARA